MELERQSSSLRAVISLRLTLSYVLFSAMFKRSRSRSRSVSRPRVSRRRTSGSSLRTTQGDDSKVPERGRVSIYRRLTNPGHIYMFKDITTQAVVSLAAGISEYGLAFTLSQSNRVAEYSALFDQFRIVGVKLDFVPRYNINAAGVANLAHQGSIHTAFDYDNVAAIGSIINLAEYDSFHVNSCLERFQRYLQPCMESNTVAAGAAIVGGQINKGGTSGPWCDVATPTISYNGVRIIVGQTATNNDNYYDIYITRYIQFKNVR